AACSLARRCSIGSGEKVMRSKSTRWMCTFIRCGRRSSRTQPARHSSSPSGAWATSCEPEISPVYLVCFVYLVHLVSFVQPNKPNTPDEPNSVLRRLEFVDGDRMEQIAD